MRLTTAMGWATVALLVHREAAALPTVIPSADVDRRMADARQRISGHPAARRVDLLVDAPGSTAPNVYVFPRTASASAELSLLVAPTCAAMQRSVDDLNALTDAAFAIADAGLALALDVARARAAQLDFAWANRDSLRVAVEGSLALHTFQDAVASLEGQLAQLDASIASISAANPADPRLPDLRSQRTAVAGQLDARRADLEATRSNRSYVAAWAVKAESDRLIDEIRRRQDILAAHSQTGGLDAALEAANAAKVAFNDLSRVDAAVGEATFPIFDREMAELIVQRQRAGERWFPGFMENLTWHIPTGVLLESPPLTYKISRRIGSMIITMDDVLPPIAGTEPGTTTVEVLPAEQIQERQTQIGGGADGVVRVRTTSLLRSNAPRVRVKLGMGAYCGNVDVQEVAGAPAEGPDGVTATPTATHFRLVPRSNQLLFEQTAIAKFETPVLGPELRSRCRLHSDDYVRTVRAGRSARDLFFWTDVARWDLTANRRLDQLGIVCDFPPDAILYGQGVRRDAQWQSQLTVWETAALFLERAGAPAPTRPATGTPLLRSFLRQFPSPMLWSSTLRRICQEHPVCELALVDPAVFDPRCIQLPDGSRRCTTSQLQTGFEFLRTGATWEPKEFSSSIGFRLRPVP